MVWRDHCDARRLIASARLRFGDHERHVVVELTATTPTGQLIERCVGEALSRAGLDGREPSRDAFALEELAFRIPRLQDAVRIQQETIAGRERLDARVRVMCIGKKPEY